MHRKCNEPECFAAVFKIQINQNDIAQNLEPDQYDDMIWTTMENLPEKIVHAHLHALEQIDLNNFYSEHGWDK